MKLYVTYCSKKKCDGILPPDELYDSPRINRFTASCRERNLNWAILSAKYGILFPSEKREKYDVTFKSNSPYWLGIQVVVKEGLPKNRSDIILKELAKTVAAQLNKHAVQEVIYYYEDRGPLQPPKGYLALLHFAVDKCDRTHGWQELLECIQRHGRIQVVTQLKCLVC